MKTFHVIITAVILSAALMLSAFDAAQPDQDKEWDVPEKYENMENPYPGEDIRTGKMLYSRNCRMCHGRDGSGGTPKARQLGYEGKLFGEDFSAQSDGVIYYKSIIGWEEEGMPNYEKKISNERDRWALVNYIRTFEEE